jgi:CRISPR-associated protein Cas2
MSWHILAYDIRDPKRLRKTHYYLKQEIIALQKSVFLLKHSQLKWVETIILRYTKRSEDAIRLYPISHPSAMWKAGCQVDAIQHLALQHTTPLQKDDPEKENPLYATYY